MNPNETRPKANTKLYLTSGGRLTFDNHGEESFHEPYDAVICTYEELVDGIGYIKFSNRIADALVKRNLNNQEPIDSSRFHMIYPSVPLAERNNTIVVIDNEPMSWKLVRLHVEQKTEIGKRALEQMAKLDII